MSEAPMTTPRRLYRPSPALIWPGLMLIIFFAIPLALLFRTSFANRDPAVYQGSGFSLDAFAQLAQPMVMNTMVFSIGLACLVALISVVIAFPATYFITRMTKRSQVVWLIAILSTLALSEVLLTFAWQILLSKKAGISNVLVFLGLMQKSASFAPSLGGVMACLVYLVIPFSFITLYPGMSRFDAAYVEASRTLGANPIRAFFTVILPVMRKPISAAFLTNMMMAIAAFIVSLVLGGPENWTIGVVISEVAITGQNLPFAAAIAVALMVVVSALVFTITKLGGKGYAS
jgi:putative spermidine/putrescine transport system permease protein